MCFESLLCLTHDARALRIEQQWGRWRICPYKASFWCGNTLPNRHLMMPDNKYNRTKQTFKKVTVYFFMVREGISEEVWHWRKAWKNNKPKGKGSCRDLDRKEYHKQRKVKSPCSETKSHIRCFSPKPLLPTPLPAHTPTVFCPPCPSPKWSQQLWSHSRVHAPPVAPLSFYSVWALNPFWLSSLASRLRAGTLSQRYQMRLVLDELVGGRKTLLLRLKTLSLQMFTGLSTGVRQNRSYALKLLRGASKRFVF